MTRFQFNGFTLDVEKRHLYRGDVVVELQPQVFDLLVYLVEHRERVVSKRELLDELWRDSVVTDASLQRAVSLARAALEGERDLIETHARRGYRFTGEVETRFDRTIPPPGYVETSDGLHLAYRVIGTHEGAGDVDLVMLPGWSFPMDGHYLHEAPRALLEKMSRIGRVILFDRRGVGLSDRIKQPVQLEARAADLGAVLSTTGSRKAVLIGVSEGAPLALYYAARHPERVAGLVLVGGFAQMRWPTSRVDELRGYIRSAWGRGATVLAMFPDEQANDPLVKSWASEIERRGASPGAALDLLEMNVSVDVSPYLADIQAPVTVLHHEGDRVIDVECGRELARQLNDVSFVESPGSDHVFLFEDQSTLLDGVRECYRSGPRA